MRILVAGGGTGGHVVPALAVSAELKRRGAEVHFICGTGAAEQRMVRAAGFPFSVVSAGKLRRYVSLKTVLEPFKLYRGYRQAKEVIRTFRPDVLFAKGGFVSLPVARAAKRLGVPIVLHESDSSPGLANRTAERWASAIAVSYPPERMAWLPSRPIVLTGNPIRRSVLKGSKARGRRYFGLSAGLPTALVLGGSLGAQRINRRLVEALPGLLPECQVIHQTGERSAADIPAYRAQVPSELQERYHPVPFLGEELPDAYAAADLVVSRAGGGLAEIAAVGKPSVLIPLSREASRGEQIGNAQYYAERKAALVLPEEHLDSQVLSRAVLKLLHDPTRRSRMGRAAKSLAHPEAAADVAKLVLDTGKGDG